ncbi:MAG: hypothetical protein QFF03_18755, partial [Pseudomonadota bacterium]|nr:hypothetical protein [Pseudomonadota bacterium]
RIDVVPVTPNLRLTLPPPKTPSGKLKLQTHPVLPFIINVNSQILNILQKRPTKMDALLIKHKACQFKIYLS